MPTERKTKPKRKVGSSSPTKKAKKSPAAAKTTRKATKTTVSRRRTVKPAQPKVSEHRSAVQEPIPGRDLIISATKIAMGTKQKATRLLKIAGDFFSDQKESGKSMIQDIGKSQSVRRVVNMAGIIPEKVKQFRQHRKSTK